MIRAASADRMLAVHPTVGVDLDEMNDIRRLAPVVSRKPSRCDFRMIRWQAQA
jgi:hypothetical protein